MDTVAFTARDGELFHRVGKAWLEAKPTPMNSKPDISEIGTGLRVTSHSRPVRLLYPEDYFPYPNPAAQALMEASVRHMESCLGIKRTAVNLAELWLQDDPTGQGISLAEYLQTVCFPIAPSFSSTRCAIVTRALIDNQTDCFDFSMRRPLRRLWRVPRRLTS